MIVGVPREIKDQEFRVSMTPGGVRLLRESGHRVLVEATAGEGSGFGDAEYRAAGADVLVAGSAAFRGGSAAYAANIAALRAACA